MGFIKPDVPFASGVWRQHLTCPLHGMRSARGFSLRVINAHLEEGIVAPVFFAPHFLFPFAKLVLGIS